MINFPMKKSGNRLLNHFQEKDDSANEVECVFELYIPDDLKNDEQSVIDFMKEQWIPSLDVFEEHGHLLLMVDLPKFAKEEIRIVVKNRSLIVRGEMKVDKDMQYGSPPNNEPPHNQYSIRMKVPSCVDTKKVKTILKDGILLLKLPKKVRPKVRRKEVDTQ